MKSRNLLAAIFMIAIIGLVGFSKKYIDDDSINYIKLAYRDNNQYPTVCFLLREKILINNHPNKSIIVTYTVSSEPYPVTTTVKSKETKLIGCAYNAGNKPAEYKITKTKYND